MLANCSPGGPRPRGKHNYELVLFNFATECAQVCSPFARSPAPRVVCYVHQTARQRVTRHMVVRAVRWPADPIASQLFARRPEHPDACGRTHEYDYFCSRYTQLFIYFFFVFCFRKSRLSEFNFRNNVRYIIMFSKSNTPTISRHGKHGSCIQCSVEGVEPSATYVFAFEYSLHNLTQSTSVKCEKEGKNLHTHTRNNRTIQIAEVSKVIGENALHIGIRVRRAT